MPAGKTSTLNPLLANTYYFLIGYISDSPHKEKTLDLLQLKPLLLFAQYICALVHKAERVSFEIAAGLQRASQREVADQRAFHLYSPLSLPPLSLTLSPVLVGAAAASLRSLVP